jgi:hypothetical protein
MKALINITEEGFRITREYLNFTSESIKQLETILAKLCGSSTVFVNGGLITAGETSFVITDAVIAKSGKLYHLTGGTFTGVVADFYVNFSEVNATDYPQQDYAESADPASTVFFERIGALNETAIGVNVLLSSIKPSAVLEDLFSGWQEVASEDITIGGIGVTDFSVKYKVNLVTNTIEIETKFNKPDANTDNLVSFALPYQFHTQYVTVRDYKVNTGEYVNRSVKFSCDGETCELYLTSQKYDIDGGGAIAGTEWVAHLNAAIIE